MLGLQGVAGRANVGRARGESPGRVPPGPTVGRKGSDLFARAAAAPQAMLATLVVAGCSDLASQPDRVPSVLKIVPADTSVLEGESVPYGLNVLDESGDAFGRIPSWALAEWTVSDPGVAAVAPDGSVTGLEGGRETGVTAALAGLRAGARVRVNPRSVRIDAAALYLTQAVQTLGGDVPLIEGRSALLRVFVTGDRTSFFRPRPRATFYVDGAPVHTMRLDPPLDRIPVAPAEGRLDRSFNGVVPGRVLQPGVEVTVELDPDGVVPVLPGSARRLPAEGRTALDVLSVPPMRVTVVPVQHAGDERAARVWAERMTPTSHGMTFIRSILPIGELESTIHEPYRTSADLATSGGWFELLREIRVLRLAEGGRGYYYGAVARPSGSPYNGLGYIGRPVGVGQLDLDTFAHELGHNMGLRHAPCGGAGSPDPDFPYDGGSIGVFGYETRGGTTRIADPSEYADLMTYCDPSWISDYHFLKALEFRREHESLILLRADPEPTILLWGSAGGGDLLLEPAFVIDAPPKLPSNAGPYRIEGFDAGGRSLFAFSFVPDELEFGGGQFAFAIPYEVGWDGAEGLDHVRLSGPAGSVTLARSGGRRVALVTDPDTGRLRGMLRGAGALPRWTAGLDIVASDGIPRSGRSRVRR